jgi:hypothetical protein
MSDAEIIEKQRNCNHKYEHKKGTWYVKCAECDYEIFLGIGGLGKICRSKTQKKCLLETAKLGQMNPDECYGCNDFY